MLAEGDLDKAETRAEAAESLGLARPTLYATAKRLGVDLVAERMGGQAPPSAG